MNGKTLEAKTPATNNMQTYHWLEVDKLKYRLILWKRITGIPAQLELTSIAQRRKYHFVADQSNTTWQFLESLVQCFFNMQYPCEFKYIAPQEVSNAHNVDGTKKYDKSLYLALKFSPKQWLVFQPVVFDEIVDRLHEAMIQEQKRSKNEIQEMRNQIIQLNNSCNAQINAFLQVVQPIRVELEETKAKVAKLETLKHIVPKAGYQNSTILNDTMQKTLNELMGVPTQQWTQVFRADSTSPFTAAAFHSKCDNKCNMMMIVHSTSGHIFGAYTPVPYNATANGGYNASSGSFVFGLRTHAKGDAPFRYNVTVPQHAVYYNTAYGPCFGSACDMCTYTKRVSY